MLRCDVMITVLETGEWEFFLNSTKGYKAFINGDRPEGLFSVVHTHEEATSIYGYISTLDDLTVHMYGADELPYQEVVFNAQQQTRDYADKQFQQEAADYYGPLFDAAIAARDKREISRLVFSYPDNVARSFVIDRLRNGPDKFPELKVEGTNLQNWFD